MASAALPLPLPSLLNSSLSRPGTRSPAWRAPGTRPSASSRLVSRQIASSPSPSSPRLRPPPALASSNAPARCRGGIVVAAYVSAPASDTNVGDSGDGAATGASAVESVSSRAPPPGTISLGVILAMLARHKLRLAVSLLALIGCTSCTLSMPIFSGKFFEILVGARSETLLDIVSKIAVVYIMEPIFTVIFIVNMTTIWEKVMASLRAQVFRRMLIQKVEFFDRYKVGELTGLLTSDLGSLKDVVSENIARDRGLRALSEVLGTICILFSLSLQLAPLLGLLILSISVLVAIFKRSTIPVFKSHGSAQARISDCATETFSAIRTVRTFAGEKRQMSMFGELVLAYQKSGMKLGILKSANESLTRVVVYISLLALYCLGGNKVKAGELTVGTMASFIGYTFTLTFAVQGGVNTLGDLRATFAAVERINSILSDTEIDDSLAYGLKKESRSSEHDPRLELYWDNPDDDDQAPSLHYTSILKSVTDGYNLAWSGDICLEDVYFSYPLRTDVGVLNGLNLTLKCGKITAVVGPSGAGKSTIVQLLARFYEPTRGRITVASEDIRTFDKRDWARVVSIVNQEPVLFSVSVGENIAYGLPDENVSKDDIVKAAKAANAHEFIISLPQGYDTPVGERGSLLSGGQRQRIAIARALLKNAPILILDEATSALDTVSERLVQEALSHLMRGRTSMVIAHRLSTVQNAHQIALCADGKIAELGTHSELLERKGLYASLVGTQRLAFE